MTDPDNEVYTFGDGATAAQRLALLAEVFEAGTRRFLAQSVTTAPGHAVDLGSGTGFTTRLLHQVTGAARTTGIERSQAFLAQALDHPVQGIHYLQHDVSHGPLPVQEVDVLHTRFLLTHLAEPGRAVHSWCRSLRPGGLLLVQEVARLVSREPVFGRYYELVTQLQQAHGQVMDIGSRLDEIAGGSGLVMERQIIRSWHPPVTAMAGLHVLNLRTWRHDAFARAEFDPDELDSLDAALLDIAQGRHPAEPIEQDLAELVLSAPSS
jgi:SAM-dependent methyltransferase